MNYSPQLILSHLQEYLPQLTDAFTNETAVNAGIKAGSPQVLRIVYNSHTYNIGDSIILAGSKLDNGINNVQQFFEDGTSILRFTTNVKHDLTEDYDENLTDGKVELTGFTDSGLNDFFTLYAVPSSTTFEIEYPTLPTLNGNETLREIRELGVNGTFEVTDVPDANTIDIDLVDRPEFDIKDVPNLKVIDSYRIMIVADWNRAKELYTKQSIDDLYLFIIMEDVDISKERRLENDAAASNTAQNELRVKNICRFTLDVVIPTQNAVDGSQAVQLAYDELYTILLAVMAGAPLGSDENSKYISTLTSHGPVEDFNAAYYAHGYSFEYIFEYTFENTFIGVFGNTTAFRRINISFADKQDGSNIILE